MNAQQEPDNLAGVQRHVYRVQVRGSVKKYPPWLNLNDTVCSCVRSWVLLSSWNEHAAAVP
jgi:hypothetical protein